MTDQRAFEVVCRALTEPSVLLLADGRIAFANDAAAALVGIPAHDLVGSDLHKLVQDAPAKLDGYLSHCSRSRTPIPGGLTWSCSTGAVPIRCDGAVIQPAADGRPALLLLRCRRRADASDRFVVLNQKIAALSNEVMQRRKAEQQRDQLLRLERAARQAAERSSVMKDEFLATLSHELRTPLNAILGWAQVISADAAALTTTARDGVGVIYRNARLQARLIDDLLDMNRILSGKLRIDVQRVDLAAIIEAAISTVLPAAQAKGIRLQRTLDTTGAGVKGDPARLQQVMWNLLSNAIKFTPKQGRIQVLLHRVNSHLEIVVSDNGEGIRPEFLPFVFDRFRQQDASTTKAHAGLGLGLSIVKQLVEMHGGHITAHSDGEGRGATFMVALPVIALEESPSQSTGPTATSGVPFSEGLQPAGPRLDGLHLLVVDDQHDARGLLRAILTRAGATVSDAGSVDAALEKASTEHFDVVITDIGMPERDGYELLRELRRIPRRGGGQIPAIAMTAFVRHDDRVRALLAGFQLHLGKPIEPLELIAAVAAVGGRPR